MGWWCPLVARHPTTWPWACTGRQNHGQHHSTIIVDPISHLKSVGWQVGFGAVKKSKSSEIMSNCQKMSDYKQGTPHSLHHCTKKKVTSGGQKLFVLSDVACCIRCGIRILGTSVEAIDACEDRNKFSQLCDRLRVDQPEWSEFATLEETKTFAYESLG